MRDSVEVRRRRIAELVDQHGALKVSSLAGLLNVSAITARRDVEALAGEGVVERRHGWVARAGGIPSARPSRATVGTVAIVLPERHSYFDEVTRGAHRALESSGYRVALHLAPHSDTSDRRVLELVRRQRPDGLLLAPRWNTPESEAASRALLAELDLPTVVMERQLGSHPDYRSLDVVRSDHRHGVELAVDHLVAGGHRRILLLARQDSPTARSISTSFVDIMRQRSVIESWVTALSSPDSDPGAGSPDSAVGVDGIGSGAFLRPDHSDPQWLVRLLDEHGITGVLIHNDENALVLTQELLASGLSIPQECAVIAYDDVVAELSSVPLTAVAPPKEEVGRTAAELLSQRLRTQRVGQRWTPRRIELLPELEVRESS